MRSRLVLARRAGAVAAALCLLWAGAHALLDRPATRERLRAELARAARARLGEEVQVGAARVDWAFRLVAGPVAVGGARAGAPPVVGIDRVVVRPSLRALLAGRVEPATIRLSGVRIAAGPDGAALRALVARRPGRVRAAQPAGAAAPDGSALRLDLEDVVATIGLRGREVRVGPLDGRVVRTRTGDDEVLDVDGRFAGGGEVALELRRGPAGVRARLSARRLGPEALTPALDGAPVALAAGTLAIDARVEAPADLSRAAAHARIAADGAVLRGARIGEEPLGPVSVDAEGDVEVDARARRATLRHADVVIQKALRVGAEGELRAVPGLPFSLVLRADGVTWPQLVAALPPSAEPPPEVPRPAGALSARLALSGALRLPAEWTVDGALDLSAMRAASRRGPPSPFASTFTYRPEPDPGAPSPPDVVVGPSNPDFVPLAELPEHVVRAVTTSEDAGFFGHSGFDFDELRNALVAGAEAGRVVRGGSTISQQLAKNLFLSRRKTIARKLREAAATVALEATLPKRRILEIYLNVAEWGPGVYGIGAAAQHWFGKDARALTPKEAAFLASVIPNPVRYHFMYARDEVPEVWQERVDGILLKLGEQGVLSGPELVEALGEPIVFRRG